MRKAEPSGGVKVKSKNERQKSEEWSWWRWIVGFQKRRGKRWRKGGKLNVRV